MDKFLIDGDFVYINTNKFKKEGVAKNRLAFIAGHRALPMNERDPYTQRIKFFVALCDDEGHVDTNKLYLMDARSLKYVGEIVQEELYNLFIKDHNIEPEGVDEEVPSTTH